MLFAACTQDTLTDGTDTLPEGMYPLQISGITLEAESSEQPWGADGPQTRVSETESGTNSKFDWDGTEQIGVQLYAEGDVATYTLNKDQTLSADKTLYWKNTSNTTVTAWYPVEKEVSLANQKEELAYVLKGSGTGDYKNPVKLDFKHALAKVRVVFSGESSADLTNASVSVLAPTSCTVNKGNVAAGGTTDYIPMHKATYNDGKVCYEANVTPNLTLGNNAFQLTIDNKTVNCSTSSDVFIQAGQLHIVTLTVNEKMTEVNVSEISGTEYTVSGNVHLKGNGQDKNLKLTMEAGSKLTLENVTLKPNSSGNVITCKGNATITLQGENVLKAFETEDFYSPCAILVEGGTLTIKGTGQTKLTVKGDPGRSGGGSGIGATNNANITINGGYIIANQGGIGQGSGIGSGGWGKTCGTITINGGIIESWGGSYSAGIGGSNSGACGDIIITGGNIKAYGGSQSPGIGNGDDAICGSITICGANTVVYAKKGSGQSPASIGWNNYNGSCGTVTIGYECTVTQE